MTDPEEAHRHGSKKEDWHPLILDGPQGQEELAKLLIHHRTEFLAADLSHQVAMIRCIREQLCQDGHEGFLDQQGQPLDEDAMILAIAKIFYQGTSCSLLATDEQQAIDTTSTEPTYPDTATSSSSSAAPNTRTATSTRTVRLPATASHNTSTTQHTAAADAMQDGAMYLASLRHHKPANRISPSPTANHSPKLGAQKGPSKRKSTTKLESCHTTPTPTDDSKGSPNKKPTEKKKRGTPRGFETAPSKRQKSTEHSVEAAKTVVLPTAAQIQARAVTLIAQTEMSGDIPRGVTVRPSGRWQSQVYFKGQSRYLGVFTDSSEAAMAWVVAKKVLTETNVNGATREETEKWFLVVKDIVTGLVLGARDATESY